MTKHEELNKLKQEVEKEKKILNELNSLSNTFSKSGNEEKALISSQINSLKKSLKEINMNASDTLKKIYLTKPLSEKKAETINKGDVKEIQKSPQVEQSVPFKNKKFNLKKSKILNKDLKLQDLEKKTIKRLKKQEEKVVKEKKKSPNNYAKMANKLFSKKALSLLRKKTFQTLERDLIKANLQFTPTTYVSFILLTTLISVFVSILLFLFFSFFNVGAELPIVTRATGNIALRFAKTFWIIIVFPIATFLIMYLYPSMEKKSAENRINHELPFATINMAAISGSLIDPSKIFNIIISTKEYPALTKEFIKIMNEINIHGYNFVGALRYAAFNSPSKKLTELFSGLATTINSGGDLPNFFEERSKTLLFEHRLEKEKESKAAETFMDVYISVVIAAPMILMLLLMMMKISGLGVSFSTSMITLIMIIGVSIINIVFLTFLQMRK